jgi:hypothetical protein
MKPPNLRFRPPATPRITLGTGQLPLQSGQSSLLPETQPRHSQEVSCGQGSGNCYAPVNSDDRSIARRRNRGRPDGEPNMPPASPIKCKAARLNIVGNDPGPSEPHPTSLGQSYNAYMSGEPSDVLGLQFDDAKALVSSGLAPCRPAVSAAVEGSHCLREVPKSLLLHHVAAGSQPRELGTRDSQLPGLFQISRRRRAPGTPMKMLLHGQVPNKSGMRAVLPKDQLLLWCRRQSVPRHTPSLVMASDNLEEVTWRPAADQELAGLAPRSR